MRIFFDGWSNFYANQEFIHRQFSECSIPWVAYLHTYLLQFSNPFRFTGALSPKARGNAFVPAPPQYEVVIDHGPVRLTDRKTLRLLFYQYVMPEKLDGVLPWITHLSTRKLPAT